MTRGRRVPRLLAYLYGPGRHHEHVDPHTVAGWDDPVALEPPTLPSGRRVTAPLAGLMEQPVWALRYRPARPVWHCSVRAAPGDRRLTDAEWRQIAEDVVHRTGLARRGDCAGCRWVAVRHADDHIHIVVTLARQDGTRAELHNDYYRVGEACAAAERRYGLTVTAGRDRTAARRASRAERERTRREGRPAPARDALRARVQVAAAGAATVEDFVDRLRREGLLVRLRESQTVQGETSGYAVALPGYRAADGQPVWFGGGKLAPDLSLPRLRRRWAAPVESPRTRLVAAVRSAAEDSVDLPGFSDRLRRAGLHVRLRESQANVGQVTGYAVAAPDLAGADGQPVWIGGGKLAPDLSLPRLRRRWTQPAEPARARLRAAVRSAADDSVDLPGFTDRLRRAGLHVRLRESQLHPGQITGYAVASPAWTDTDGMPVWLAGGALAPDLSLPALGRRWSTTPADDGTQPAAPRPTAAARQASAHDRAAAIHDASRAAAWAADQMSRAAAGDPVAASIAQAAGDVYAAAARVLDGRSRGALTAAAEDYYRATRQPWGHGRTRSQAAAELRQAARRLLLVGRMATAGEASAMQMLLLQLASTAEALAALRASQQRAAQSAAARRAAEAAVAAHQARLIALTPTPVPAARRVDPPSPPRGPAL